MTKDADSSHSEGKQKVKARETLDRESALAHLEDVLGGVRHGGLRLRSGDTFIDLVPGQWIEVVVSARQKDGMQRLSLDLTWPFDPSTVRSGAEPEAVAAGSEEYGSSMDATSAASRAAVAEGLACVADQARDLNREVEDEEYCNERRFELELLGGCDCYAVPQC